MKDLQSVIKLIETSKGYEIDKYREVNLNKTHSPFEGTPKKHPNDKNVLILVTSPFTEHKEFYEFSIESIGNIEELGTITSENGNSAYKIRVWVKKGMPALKTEPFIIE